MSTRRGNVLSTRGFLLGLVTGVLIGIPFGAVKMGLVTTVRAAGNTAMHVSSLRKNKHTKEDAPLRHASANLGPSASVCRRLLTRSPKECGLSLPRQGLLLLRHPSFTKDDVVVLMYDGVLSALCHPTVTLRIQCVLHRRSPVTSPHTFI